MYQWFYVWSPRYRIFHEILLNSTADISGIEMKPQFVPQSIFEKKNDGKHFLTGIGIKIHVLIKILESHPDTFVIFSDVDLIVPKKDLAEKLKVYETNDITCMCERKDSKEYNIGFMLVKSTPSVIQFLTRVLQQIRTNNMLDQDAFNEEIKSFEGKHGMFDTKDFIQSNMIRKDIWDSGNYSVIQCLASNSTWTDMISEKLHTIIYFYDIRHFLDIIDIEVRKSIREHLQVNNPNHYLCHKDLDSYFLSATQEFPQNP